MKAVRIKMYQNFVNYRIEGSYGYVQTYPLPTPSMVRGMCHALLELQEYKSLSVSIQGSYDSVVTNMQKIYKFDRKGRYPRKVFVGKSEVSLNQGLMYVDEIINMELLLHVSFDDEKLTKKLAETIKQKTLVLGRNEDIANVDYEDSGLTELSGIKRKLDMENNMYVSTNVAGRLNKTGTQYRLPFYYEDVKDFSENRIFHHINAMYITKGGNAVRGDVQGFYSDSKTRLYIFCIQGNRNMLAKTKPIKTIEEHTVDVHKAYHNLSENVFFQSIWEKHIKKYDKLIIKLIDYHDMGKMYHKFQNKLNKFLGRKERINIPELRHIDGEGRYPHGWLSATFMEGDYLFFYKYNEENVCFYNLAQYCIINHHTRDYWFDSEELKRIIKYDLSKRCHLIGFDGDFDVSFDPNYIISEDKFEKYMPYLIFLKGILHKCDYAASAEIAPEQPYIGSYSGDFDGWLVKKGWTLKDFQKQAKVKADKNIILIASTGVGKTEFSMNWIDGGKAFYLLGLRTAVNAMYDRFSEIFNGKNRKNVELVHGDVGFKFADESKNDDEYFDTLAKARLLSMPLTVATADQLVTSVFKYNGFEHTYLTASYSKIVVDEIQSFSPESMAAIVVFLQEISGLGGKFLLMTATLPPFVKEDLKKFIGEGGFEEIKEFSDKKRHRIKMLDTKFLIRNDEAGEGSKELCIAPDVLELIKNKYNEGKKVLVICNIVGRAQDMYDALEELKPKLLHSRFVKMDRRGKEQEILIATKEKVKEPCIWISTQLVEASLDIDFDVLVTESATIDSLFQRFGRCYRGRDYESTEPNIFIAMEGEYSSLIYNKEILKKTWQVLEKHDGMLLAEETKQEIITEVFENVKNTKYYEDYKHIKTMLMLGLRADNKKEAGSYFRNITNSYMVIPKPVYEKNREDIDNLAMQLDEKVVHGLERAKVRSRLMEYTFSMQIRGNKKTLLMPLPGREKFSEKFNLKILDGVTYNEKRGVVFDKNIRKENGIDGIFI